MSTARQLTVGAVANFGNLMTGMTYAFSGVVLPAMMVPEHVPTVTYKEASWIASLVSFGTTIGCLLLGPLMEKIGRRGTILLSTVPSILGWLLIATASLDATWFFVQLYVGRILTGVGGTLVITPPIVYCSEALDKNVRGMVTVWNAVAFTMGNLVMFVLGAVLPSNWRLIAWLSVCVPALYLLAVWRVLPESPVWLLTKGRRDEAETALRRVRGRSLPAELQRELQALAPPSPTAARRETLRERLAFVARPEAYKPLLILNLFSFFMQFSGCPIVLLYTVSLIKDMNVNVEPYTIAIIIGVVRVVMTIVGSYVSRRFGRRFLCNVSGLGMTLSFAALALFLGLMHAGVICAEEAERLKWLPALFLILVVVTSNLGFCVLPSAMRGELFPTKIRSNASAFTSFLASFFLFLSAILYPHMKEGLGFHNVFLFNTAVSAIGIVVMYIYLPETQGKTLAEIEEYFKTNGKPTTLFTRREKDHLISTEDQSTNVESKNERPNN